MKDEWTRRHAAGGHRRAHVAQEVPHWWWWPLRIAVSQLVAAAIRWIIEHGPW